MSEKSTTGYEGKRKGLMSVTKGMRRFYESDSAHSQPLLLPVTLARQQTPYLPPNIPCEYQRRAFLNGFTHSVGKLGLLTGRKGFAQC